MPRSLPPNPTVEALKKEAKELLKAHRNDDPATCEVLRVLDRFSGCSDSHILGHDLKLTEVQYALALEYGSDSWDNLVSDIAYQDRKHVEKLDGGYRYTCKLESIKKPRRRFFSYSDLTLEEHARNQHYNELHSLLALSGVSRVPDVVEYSESRLTMTVKDMGQQSNFPDRRILADGLRGLAEIHEELELKSPVLKRCWHALVDPMWYFQFSAQRAEQLRETRFSKILDELPALLDMAAALPKRHCHGDPTEGNTTYDGERVCFIDFGDSHVGHQMNDVAVFLSDMVWKDGPVSFGEWMDWWGEYANCRGNCTDEDLREFLFCTIRKSSRRLSKNKPCSSELFSWLIVKGSCALDELNRIGL